MNIYEHIQNCSIHSCGISDCDSTWQWDTGESGFHDFDFWVVIRGEGKLTTGGKSIPVSKGSVLLLMPHTHYIGTHDIQNPIMAMNVHFQFHADTLLPQMLPPFLLKENADISYIRDLLYRVIRLYNANDKELSEIVFKTALIEFFGNTVLPYQTVHNTQKADLMKKICDTLNTSPSDAPPLSYFAKKYGYSQDYLSRLFTSIIGIPYIQYVANTKVNLAKNLLVFTGLTVEAIATELGYYDACYFTRQFKKITGVSPGKYRKENQRQIQT